MLKLQCLAVASSSANWLYAYRRSMVEKYTSLLCDESDIDCAMLSIRQSILCIWYLFFWIALLMTLESIASFIVLSRSTVITICEIKLLSLHLSSLIMLPFFWSFLSSSSTWDCRWVDWDSPSSLVDGVKFVLKFFEMIFWSSYPFFRLGNFWLFLFLSFVLLGFVSLQLAYLPYREKFVGWLESLALGIGHGQWLLCSCWAPLWDRLSLHSSHYTLCHNKVCLRFWSVYSWSCVGLWDSSYYSTSCSYPCPISRVPFFLSPDCSNCLSSPLPNIWYCQTWCGASLV